MTLLAQFCIKKAFAVLNGAENPQNGNKTHPKSTFLLPSPHKLYSRDWACSKTYTNQIICYAWGPLSNFVAQKSPLQCPKARSLLKMHEKRQTEQKIDFAWVLAMCQVQFDSLLWSQKPPYSPYKALKVVFSQKIGKMSKQSILSGSWGSEVTFGYVSGAIWLPVSPETLKFTAKSSSERFDSKRSKEIVNSSKKIWFARISGLWGGSALV